MNKHNSPIICPACGGSNRPEAVFCANPSCHKALGDFRYALEEQAKKSRWHEMLVNQIARFIGKPHFVGIHLAVIGIWMALNAGFLMFLKSFDAYPFGLLGLVLSIEAILITSILVINTSGQADLANTRAELDYEVNVQTYREIIEIQKSLDKISDRLDAIEKGSNRGN